jgi:hypothetical protein
MVGVADGGRVQGLEPAKQLPVTAQNRRHPHLEYFNSSYLVQYSITETSLFIHIQLSSVVMFTVII